MEGLWSSGIALIRLVRELAPGILGAMSFITDLGGTYFYLLLIPAIYWSIELRLGRRLVWVLLLSFGLNTWLKLIFRQPRPYWIVPDLPVLGGVGGFGFPSGHAQHAAAVWGSVALYEGFSRDQRRWLTPLAMTLTGLIGFSRVYLGVHLPTDVLVGWLVGGALAWGAAQWRSRLARWPKPISRRQRLLLALCMALVAGGIAGTLWPILRSWSLPPEWQMNALANSGAPIDPTDTDTLVGVAGLLVGVVVGLVWNARRGPSVLGGSLAERLGRLLVGLLVGAAVWFGLRLLGGSMPPILGQVLRFTRYGLLALWVAGAAPICFRSLGLAHEPLEA